MSLLFRKSKWFRTITKFVLWAFVNELVVFETARLQQAYAQEALSHRSGRLLSPSSQISLPSLKAIRINPENPFEIDFIIDGADTGSVNPEEAARLIKYFLAVLTIPEDELWVNLSPYEADRIMPDQLAATQTGKDLLEQDYLLKQLAASLTYPEDPIGKAFWTRMHQKAQDMPGTTEIPVETFNKIWIIPENAVVYEFEHTAFIAESRLAVMLEQDYLSLQNNGKGRDDPAPGPGTGGTSRYGILPHPSRGNSFCRRSPGKSMEASISRGCGRFTIR